jgi:hypothetical protein
VLADQVCEAGLATQCWRDNDCGLAGQFADQFGRGKACRSVLAGQCLQISVGEAGLVDQCFARQGFADQGFCKASACGAVSAGQCLRESVCA